MRPPPSSVTEKALAASRQCYVTSWYERTALPPSPYLCSTGRRVANAAAAVPRTHRAAAPASGDDRRALKCEAIRLEGRRNRGAPRMPATRPRAPRSSAGSDPDGILGHCGSCRSDRNRPRCCSGPRTCRQLLPEAASILADTRRQPVLEIAGDLEMKIFGGGCSCGRLAKAAAPASLSASIVQIHRVLVACSGLLQAQPLGLLIDKLVGIGFE